MLRSLAGHRSSNEPKLVCDSIELWFRERGHSDYSHATDLASVANG